MKKNELFLDKFRIKSTRLPGYDYGRNGHYFVTICTKGKERYFGEIVKSVETHHNASSVETPWHNVKTHHNASPVDTPWHNAETHHNASLRPTEIGKIAQYCWEEIPIHFPFVRLDEFTIMPDHLHGILEFRKKDPGHRSRSNQFGPQSGNLGSVVRGYKSAVKTFAVKNQIDFAWQARYFDRIIRNAEELNKCRMYIRNNAQNWLDGKAKIH